MGIKHKIAQYRAAKRGVVHTTLNPLGPGAVRIHLVPPQFNLFQNSSYVVILNGYYILPLGYAWAVLLENFIEELNVYDGKPMDERGMQAVVQAAVERTHKVYAVDKSLLADDLGTILEVLFDVARGDTPKVDIGAVSLRDYAPHMQAPHRMDLLVSPMTDTNGNWNCNLKCQNCYAAGQPAASAKALDTKSWLNIIDRCQQAGIPQMTFTGGEPTMRADLVTLIGHAQWFVTRLNTNGTLLSPQLCKQLKNASLDSVQITLYAADAKTHNVLVGAGLEGSTGNWDKAVAGLRNALEAGLDVSVNTPLCKENKDYNKTLRFLLDMGVRYVSCSGIIETGKAAKNLSGCLEKKEITAVLQKAAAFCSKNGMELSFTSPGQVDAAELQSMGLSVPMCGACLSNMAIAPNGDVVPCQSWLADGYALGNMLTDTWKRMWNHPSCTSIRGMDEQQALLCPLRIRNIEGGNC